MCICVYILVMDSAQIIKKIKKDGWYKVAQKGSHIQFKHPYKRGRVTIKHPVKDVTMDNIKSMEKQSGVKLK